MAQLFFKFTPRRLRPRCCSTKRRLVTTSSIIATLVYISIMVYLKTLQNRTTPNSPSETRETESEFEFHLSTRRLTLLATRRINEIVKQQAPVSLPCSSWWSNPLDVQRHVILQRGPEFVDHLLEFVADSSYERRVFNTVAREAATPPHAVHFVNDSFTRIEEAPFRKFINLHNCLTPEEGVRLDNGTRAQLESLCSCEKPDTGFEILDTWPPNSSFFVGDYMNFTDEESMFNILPEDESQHCGDQIQMLVMVSSAPNHTEHRKAIRETYGSRQNLDKYKAELVFLFGRVENETLQIALEEEALAHGDLIQANFMDSYHNLTLSHLSMYSYVHFSCSNLSKGAPGSYTPPSYIFKADDDFLLNLDTALAVAAANPDVELFGCSFCNTTPIRHHASKYYTPRYMYMDNFYPGYLSGVAYMIKGAVLPLFVNASQSIPLIVMDDAYITGLVPRELGIYPRYSNLFGYERAKDVCELRQMATSFVWNQADMRKQWRVQQKFGHENCTLATSEQLKVSKLTKEFKTFCRYAL